jgi:pantothenate kinase
MSYEEFLDLPVEYVRELAKIIHYKRENRLPFSAEEKEVVDHFIRYTNELKLQETKAMLEYCYELESYKK